MRLSWIIGARPKSNDQYLYQKQKRQHKGEGKKIEMEMEAEIGVMRPQAKNTWGHQKPEEVRKDAPLQSLGEVKFLMTP